MGNIKNILFFINCIATIVFFMACSSPEENEIIESTPPAEKVYVTGAETIIPYHTLKMYLDENFSQMYFLDTKFNKSHGGSYVLDYFDEGGQGMDSYPSITIGSVTFGNNYWVSDKAVVGMPVQLKDISNTLTFDFKTSQLEANDIDDKWMASINFIFDNYGTETSEPVASERDYDLVIMHAHHNFNDSVEDKPLDENTKTTHWYFARNSDKSLKPYHLTIDGKTYTYAVRYKFFINSGDKNNKTHLKFIPYGNTELPEILKINVKEVIQITKDYLPYVNLTPELRTLAETNIALPNAWLKSINAGYEVYTGNATLKIEQFRVNL